jgi:hypothetical protein
VTTGNEKNGNGTGKTTAMWIAMIISASGATATLSYAVTKASIDNTGKRLDGIEEAVREMNNKIELKIGAFSGELNSRVEKANETHKAYEIRLDRLERKAGI